MWRTAGGPSIQDTEKKRSLFSFCACCFPFCRKGEEGRPLVLSNKPSVADRLMAAFHLKPREEYAHTGKNGSDEFEEYLRKEKWKKTNF